MAVERVTRKSEGRSTTMMRKNTTITSMMIRMMTTSILRVVGLVHLRILKIQPPAIAPTMRNGSAPLTTSSGNCVSGGSSDKSSLQAKKRTNGRRFNVP